MSDAERLADLEERVSLLMLERAAYTGAISLLVQLLAALERDRKKAGQPSLIEAMDAGFVAQQMADPPGTHPQEMQMAATFAQSILQVVRDATARGD